MSSNRKSEQPGDRRIEKPPVGRAAAPNSLAEKDSSRNAPLLPPAAAWADPMASVAPLQTIQGVRNQPPLPPVDRDPMAPVEDLLPPSALPDSAGPDGGVTSVPQPDAVP